MQLFAFVQMASENDITILIKVFGNEISMDQTAILFRLVEICKGLHCQTSVRQPKPI